MNISSVQTLLLIHILAIGLILLVVAFILNRRKLFRWATAGFWAWASFALYFLISPAAVLLSGDYSLYQMRLSISGGIGRGVWILLMASVGMVSFFISYLHTKPAKATFGITPGISGIPLPVWFVLITFISIGLYSLLTYRAGLLRSPTMVVIEQGRFVGEVSGYQSSGYLFLFVPTLYLLFSKNSFQRLIGLILAIGFLLLSLPHAWSRFITVSMLIALSIVMTLKRNRAWPGMIIILIILIIGAAFQIRSHASWTLASSLSEFTDVLSEVPKKGIGVFAEDDTSMLPTWYVESYLKDTITNYDYGLLLVNYLVSGWIPNRLFPQKYFLIDYLDKIQSKGYPPTIDALLFGSKSSLLGSFYAHGGWLAVVLFSFATGFLWRKIDGWLQDDKPPLMKAIGVTWMCVMWMVWGSHDYWGVSLFGALTIPGVFIWLATPKVISRRSRGRVSLNQQTTHHI